MVWNILYLQIPWMINVVGIILALQFMSIFWFTLRLLANPLDNVQKKRVVKGIVVFLFSFSSMLYHDFVNNAWFSSLVSFFLILCIAYFYSQLRKSEDEESFCISSVVLGISAVIFLTVDLLALEWQGGVIAVLVGLFFIAGLIGTPFYLIMGSSSESPIKMPVVGMGLLLLSGVPQLFFAIILVFALNVIELVNILIVVSVVSELLGLGILMFGYHWGTFGKLTVEEDLIHG